jgi:hypothetical protein
VKTMYFINLGIIRGGESREKTTLKATDHNGWNS